MDESFSVAGSKFPDGEPNDEWTVEELLHWSLDQYHSKAIDQTSQNIASLRDQCEKECEDAMTLHTLAVDMANKKGGNDGDGRDEENLNPQQSDSAAAGAGTEKISSTSTAAGGGTKPLSSIEIVVTDGPHASSKYLLRPRPNAPCLVGRSKGKKFQKNGISLHKDQEVSTTHGKFIMEGGGLASTSEGESAVAGGGPKFYFVDVGSTNGSVYKTEQLEPNKRLLLVDGMDLKVGNSMLKIFLG